MEPVGGAGVGGSHSVGEGDSAEVGKGNERAALLVVLNDPLGILLAKRGSRSDRLCDGFALGDVLDNRGTGFGAGGGDGQLDAVTRGERNAGEVVGVVGVPLIPSYSELVR